MVVLKRKKKKRLTPSETRKFLKRVGMRRRVHKHWINKAMTDHLH